MHHREHTVAVHAPADAVYGLVADATRWPLIFGPTVYVQSSEHAAPADGTGLEQRFRIWAQVSERVMGWTSSRSLDHRGLRISFRQEQAQPPVARMSGQWRFEPLGHDTTRVVLLHEYAAVDDDSASPGGRGSSRGETPGEARPDMPSSASPGGRPPSDHVRWIDAALDRNSTAELGAVKAWAERGHRIEDLVSSFEDRMAVRGPAAQVYAFLHRADLWPDRAERTWSRGTPWRSTRARSPGYSVPAPRSPRPVSTCARYSAPTAGAPWHRQETSWSRPSLSRHPHPDSAEMTHDGNVRSPCHRFIVRHRGGHRRTSRSRRYARCRELGSLGANREGGCRR